MKKVLHLASVVALLAGEAMEQLEREILADLGIDDPYAAEQQA